MTALIICAVVFLLGFLCGRRSLGLGLVVVVGTGYLYGITRAHILSPFSHFIFDSALTGFLLSQPWAEAASDVVRLKSLRSWLLVLIGFPLALLALPFQTILISIVGLRGNAFFLPAILLGGRLKQKDLMTLAYGLALLNLGAMAVAAGEYVLGVERFFPFNPMTTVIYQSVDVAGGKMRIPATFINAHAYAGTMVTTLPFLFGAWTQKNKFWPQIFLMSGIGAALLGVLMASTRVSFVIAALMVGYACFAGLSGRNRILVIVGLAILSVVALSNERFQRFKSLGDTDKLTERIGGSVNRSFFEVMIDYPMGNGLGGGGTSIPHFLQSQLRRPVAIESEYARILLEQGLLGLGIWMAFIAWFVTRNPTGKDSWQAGRKMGWICCMCFFGSSAIGVGMLTSIPQSVLFLLIVGWVAAPPVIENIATLSPTGRAAAFAMRRSA